MNAPDLPLIEFSREDDSLLEPQDDAVLANVNSNSPSNNPYFACSPLIQIPRSKSVIPSPSPIGNAEEKCEEKENLNANKAESPQFGVDTQKMKRKKRAGGFNLRKSLAWHQAFFTEEGVLDPMELSMLSGGCGNSGGEILTIHEDQELGSEGSFRVSKFPASSPGRVRKIGATQSPKPASSAQKGAASAQSERFFRPKILTEVRLNTVAVHGRPPSGSKSIVESKFPKVSKLSTPKLDTSVVSTTSRTLIPSATQLKRNPISKPVSSRKIMGVKSTSTDAKNVRKDVKSGPIGKSLTKSTGQQARRNVIRSAPATHSSTNVHHIHVANNICVPDPAIPPAAHSPSVHDGSTRKVAPLSQDSCDNGGNMQGTQSQVAKPSGLRMPSPSLRFFDQSIHSGLHRNTRPGNLSEATISSVHKLDAVSSVLQRPPQSAGKPQTSESGVGCHVASIANPDSLRKIKSGTELNSAQKVVAKFSSKSTSDNILHCQRMSHGVSDDVILRSESITERKNYSDDCLSEMHEDQLSFMHEVNKQSKEEEEPTKPVSDLESQRCDVKTETWFEGCRSTEGLNSSNILKDADPSPNAPECNASEPENSDSLFHCTDAELTKDDGDGGGSVSREFDKEDLHLVGVDANLSVTSCDTILSATTDNNSEIMIVDYPSEKLVEVVEPSNPLLRKEKANQDSHVLHSNGHLLLGESFSSEEPEKKNGHDSCGSVSFSREFDKEDLHQLQVVANLSVTSCNTILSVTTQDNSEFMIVDDPSEKLVEVLESPNPLFITEKMNQDDHVLHSNGHLLLGESFSSEEPKKKIVHDTCGNEFGSNVLGSIPPVEQGCDLAASTDPEAMVEDFSIELQGNPLELKRMSNSNMVDAANTCNIDGTDVSGYGRDFDGRESEEPHITPPCPLVQDRGASNIINKKGALVIEPPPNAAPFSDEWLAAMEAAGEEILTKKGGAVQNSPPDKSLPEPGPWSPVKRKNNQGIGPFDCTKFTNINTAPSTLH
ncbi:hypothetical protein Tsubulata_036424 [Turnera subulata]|uniref:Uncharacterized protein n=1 Tax=Turnera subulata TaxID=218843 RepID=A0A9Q0FH16_9ROSI|nr:hypothetical protein Tsubulata_036424 [Turnera subulata]